LASIGGYDDFPDILLKLKTQKDDGNKLSLSDQQFSTIKSIFSELSYTPPTDYGFSEQIYNFLEKDITKIFEKIFEEEISQIRNDDANTRHP
jgi:hypothetical protein